MNPHENVSEIEESSRAEVLCKRGVLKDFTKFTRKHQGRSLFFNKVAGPRLQLY